MLPILVIFNKLLIFGVFGNKRNVFEYSVDMTTAKVDPEIFTRVPKTWTRFWNIPTEILFFDPLLQTNSNGGN